MKIKNIICIGCLVVSGCTLDIPLEDQFSDPDAITDIASARSLLASAYESMPQHIYELSLLSDDFYPSSKLEKDANMQNIYRWQITELVQLAGTLWNGYYQTVANVNTLLARMKNVVTVDDAGVKTVAEITAQAKALKAWCYFDLLRLFAPRYTGNENADGIILKDRVELDYLPRSSVKACVVEIRKLLQEAGSVENRPDKVYWMSDKAITYLWTELELYAGNYPEVIRLTENLETDYPKEVLGQTVYTALWSAADSQARIFAKYQLSLIFHDVVYNEYSSGDYLVLNDDITYEEGDIRKEWSEYPFVMDDTRQVRLFGKYNRMNREDIKSCYVNYMRAAGFYLMRAEALARTAQAGAAELMDIYLQQRGCPGLAPGIQGEALVNRILEERRKEFVGEGVRYFDLKRWGNQILKRYTKYGTGAVSTIKADDYRWTLPIPASEYRYNELVTQNPGWEKVML